MKGCIFTYGDGIAGRTYYVRLPDGRTLESETTAGDDKLAKITVAQMLRTMGYDYQPEEIKFTWNGWM